MREKVIKPRFFIDFVCLFCLMMFVAVFTWEWDRINYLPHPRLNVRSFDFSGLLGLLGPQEPE